MLGPLTLTLLSISLFSGSASAGVVHGRHPHPHDDHSHNVARLLPGQWFQRDDHSVHGLFKRGTGGATDGVTYATVGSPEWAAPFPPGGQVPDPKAMPVEWLNALNDAVSRGAIPNIPVATNPGTDLPVYAGNLDPNGPEVCSASFGCRIPTDVWDAPDGHIAISFDDGPLPPTDTLLTFLDQQNPPQPVTHFMIGVNIIQQATQFTRAFQRGDDIAVHTWTHPLMTTLSNEQVVAELGWTMEVIHNSTGGRVPRFWRPPQGNTDTRVSAIAREVFGMTTVIWNQDTADWSLDATPPGTTVDKVNAELQQWITGPKSPGLIILEHELSEESVGTFKTAYPLMAQNGWTLGSLATVMGNGTAYQNAASDSAAVVRVENLANPKAIASGAASVSAPAGGASSAAPLSGAGASNSAGGSSASSTAAQSTASSSTGTSSAPTSSKTGAASRRASASTGISLALGAVGTLMLWS